MKKLVIYISIRRFYGHLDEKIIFSCVEFINESNSVTVNRSPHLTSVFDF